MARWAMNGLVAVLAPVMLTGATAPAAPDLSSAIAFSDAKNCLFGRVTEALFSKMLRFDERKGTWLTQPRLKVGPLSLPTRRIVAARDDVIRGGKDYRVSVQFPAGTLWNGLRLTEIRRREGYYPETDSFEARELVFLETPTRVQAVLKQLGLVLPLAPDYLEIGEDGIGFMSLFAEKTGAVINCNWGA